MNEIAVEIACGSLSEVKTAVEAGANRVELCGELALLGGITPSAGLLNESANFLRQAGGGATELCVMLRPRGGDFCYTDDEFKTMLSDAKVFCEAGVDAIVFGILKKDCTIDTDRCCELINFVSNLQKPAGFKPGFVFHRAFDATPDYKESLDTLKSLNVVRVLSSGCGFSNAEEGAEMLKKMNEHAAGCIEILPGGGVRAGNVGKILKTSGCKQAHFSLRKNDSHLFSVEETRAIIQTVKECGRK
ncbi:copper homeostasis protein CutC [Spirochaetia bacterium]|nr:copper homeostasis protein CutC [Spirochaetia bacterium]